MNFIVLGIAFIVVWIHKCVMNLFSLTARAITAYCAFSGQLLEHKNNDMSRNLLEFQDGTWTVIGLANEIGTETQDISAEPFYNLDSQSTAPNPLDQWAVVDRPPELDNCECGWKDVVDEAEKQKREFAEDPFHTLERPKPGRGQYGVDKEEIERNLAENGLTGIEVLNSEMSRIECAKRAANGSWNELKANTTQKAPELLKGALGMRTAYNSVQGMSSIAVPTSLEAVPGTVSSVGQVVGSCASAYALAPKVAKDVRDIFIPACELSSCIWVIGSEKAKEYGPGLQRNCAQLINKASSVTRSLKHGLHRFTSRR